MGKCEFCNNNHALTTKYYENCQNCPHKHGLYGGILSCLIECDSCNNKGVKYATHTLCDRCHKLFLQGYSYHKIMVILANSNDEK